MCRALWALILVMLTAAPSWAAVFQFAVPVETKRGERMAYLWIPPQAKQVRGVIVGGMTLMEREFAQDEQIRQACAEEQLAIVFLKCGLRAADLQKVLDDLARVSGYQELSVAPLMFVGHSAGGPQAQELACKMNNRCFGLVQYRGADPGSPTPIASGIPALMMIGQFDEFGTIGRDENGVENWERGREQMADFRAMHKRNLGSIVVEPGAGHFAWSDRNAKYLALFIRKAAQARIPKTWPIDSQQPIALNEIDTTSGWLTDLAINKSNQFPPAAYQQYKGDKSKTAWHFDKEMAEATVAYHVGLNKKDQFIKWHDPHWVEAGARAFFTQIKWVDDGQTFEVHPVYANTYPQQFKGRGPIWGKAGQPVGHCSSPIRIKQVSGPIVVVGPNKFRMEYDELAPATENARVTFMAYSIGDKDFRYTEKVGMMPREAAKLTKGKAQTISFPSIGNLKADSKPVSLKATSDSELPVEYHVAYGPAKISKGKLAVTDIPVRATFPIKVKVVAYQFGRGVEPFVQTAMPVEQVFKIERE